MKRGDRIMSLKLPMRDRKRAKRRNEKLKATENEGESKKGKIGKWRFASLVLVICLGVSVGFNVYQHFSAFKFFDVSESSRAFVFLWPPSDQEIVDGTLRIEAVFSWETENLSITVKVNDDEYCAAGDYIGLVFDSNKNGDLFDDRSSYALYVGGIYADHEFSVYRGLKAILTELGFLCTGGNPEPSPYHTCTFNNETGYTFEISFPKETINFHWPMLLHVCFWDLNLETLMGDWVWIQLRLQ